MSSVTAIDYRRVAGFSWAGIVVARQSEVSNGPRFETITSNRLAIEKGSLIAGNISFQIRNIASLLVSKGDEPADWVGKTAAAVAGAFLGGLLLAYKNFGANINKDFGAGLFVAGPISFVIVYGIAVGILSKIFVKYQLQLLTNAAVSFLLVHPSERFLLLLKGAIEEAMQERDRSTLYQVNIAKQKIDRVEANTTHVSHSPGAAVIGGSARNVSQSTNVVVQGLQDISALIALVERSNNEYKEFYVHHLETVQQYLAGTRSKQEAKASWEKFIKYVGLLAAAGNNIWTLVGRIGGLLA